MRTVSKLHAIGLSYELLFDCNPQPMWVYDLETLAFLAVNEAAVASYGYSRDEFLSMTIRDIRPVEDVPDLLEIVAARGPGFRQSGLWRHRRKNGTMIVVEISSHTIVAGGRDAALVMANDVTERVASMHALAESEERYREVFEADLTANYVSTVGGQLLVCNETFARMLGFESVREVLEVPAFSFYPRREDREAFLDVLRRQGRVDRCESTLVRRDGTAVHALESAIGTFDAGGTLVKITGFIYDNTHHKRLEEQLLQSHKMEAVGRLAGGIAHDFNNMLTVISGYSNFLARRLDAADPLQRDVGEIRGACDRATALTRQLLAFGRKQVTQPKPVNVNAIVADMKGMLQRLLGEGVFLRDALEPDLWNVKIDPSQFEQIVMNLAANARDAMEGAGTLTIETRNTRCEAGGVVAPGDYVLFTVADTGAGMDDETRAHVFEPFFTTKPLGKGTGLGLATVYGIVAQSGGTIWVQSEPGRGTAFTIYLPRTYDRPEPFRRPSPAAAEAAGTETLLLVEDEPGVRGLAAAVLRAAGYTVLEAANGEEALALSRERREPIHLVVTDVVMPGMNGRELAERLAEARPDPRILFISGYTGPSVVDDRMLTRGRAFLQKPFTPGALTAAVRDLLDSPGRNEA